MILKGYNFDGRCVHPMLEKRPYFSLLPFKEARRMQMAKPERISEQPKGREVYCLGMRRYRKIDFGNRG